MTGDFLGYFYFSDIVDSSVNSIIIHLNDLLTLGAVGLLDGILDSLDSLFLGKDS